MDKFIILDRDNTLNYDSGYLHKPENLKILNGIIQGLSLLNKYGYRFIVVSNQSGVGRGYFNLNDVVNVNNKLDDMLIKHDIQIEKFYFCPHSPEANCTCRKPMTGLFDYIMDDFDIDKSKSFMIGDKKSDIVFGKRVGLRTIKIKTDKNNSGIEDFFADNLQKAARWIISNYEK